MEITSIIQHVFKQPSLEGVSLAELEKFTARQPFFAVGQYLLLKKMQDIRDPSFEKQLQKTRLYFENPLWLQQLLLSKSDKVPTIEMHADSIENAGSVENQTETIERNIIDHGNGIITEDISITVVEDDIYADGPEPQINTEHIIPKEPADQIIAQNHSIAEIELINQAAEKVLKEPEIAETSEPVVEPAMENLPEISTASTIAVESEPDVENNVSESTNNQANIDETEKEEEGKPGFVLPPYSKPPEQIENQLVFQAYHTIDYFASQGIKISNKAEMSDKLGTQLKSFTEWLKTMKRLPPSKMEQQMEEKESEVVIEMAAHSLESKEVLTETMAEVLLKQGKKESAIEVYNKLSLLNPSKTPYFAAKIEEIKRN